MTDNAPVMDEEAAPVVKYEPSQAALAQMREELAPLIENCSALVRTPDGYERIRVAVGTLRSMRTGVEKKRVELKAKALEYGRTVDGKAKEITSELLKLETPLKAAKDHVDHEKEDAKRREEEARLQAIRDAEEAKRREEEAKLQMERDRLASERIALEAEKKVMEQAQRLERDKAEAAARVERERLAAERERLEAERRKVEAEKERLDRIEFERITKEKAIAEAEARAEEAAKERRAAALRLEALRPDIERIQSFARVIQALDFPKLQDPRAKSFMTDIRSELFHLADRCSAFK